MQDAPNLFEGDHQASLRETPFFDVFRHVLSAQPQVLDTVLANLSEYGAKVHGSNWSLELLQGEASSVVTKVQRADSSSAEFAQFLPRLARQTIDFEKADAFDPNPTLELLLLVLKNHSQHAHVRQCSLLASLRLTYAIAGPATSTRRPIASLAASLRLQHWNPFEDPGRFDAEEARADLIDDHRHRR